MLKLILTSLTFALASSAIAINETFQTYPNHSCTFDYQRSSAVSPAACQQLCALQSKCVLSTFALPNSCYLSATDQHTLADTGTTLQRKEDRSQCGTATCTGSKECSRLDSVAGTCTAGFSCSCQCFTDADCQQNQMDLGCNQCTNKHAQTGFGTCTSSTPILAPRPPPSTTCSYPPTKDTQDNRALSTNLDLVFVFDTTATWSPAGSQFASALINNLTIADGYGKVSFIRAGAAAATATTTEAAAAAAAAAVLVNLTYHNSTLNRVLSMAPTIATAPVAAIDPFVDAMELSSSMFETGRRSVLIVVSHSMPVDACAKQDPVSWSRNQKDVEIISVSLGSQVSNTQAMIASTQLSAVAINGNPTAASQFVIDLLLQATPSFHRPVADKGPFSSFSSLCGRQCAGNLHCETGATCALCNGNGTCGAGTCALPIPSQPMNANVSSQLEMILVIDAGARTTALQSLAAAGSIGLNFTNAKIATIVYSDLNSPMNVSAFPISTQSLSALTCNDACGATGTGGLAKALIQAGNLLNQSLGKSGKSNTTGPLQVVVVVSSQVRANLQRYYAQPVTAARSLWSSGVQVFSLIADQLCTYGSSGFSENYECHDANMLGATDGTIHTIDLRKTTIAIAASTVSEAIVDVHRTLPTCTWKEFKHRRVALAFRTFYVDSQGTCVERCCRHRRCKATTVHPLSTGGGVLCRLHDRWQIPFTLPSPDSSLFRKEDKAGCNRYCLTNAHCEFHGCGKCNFLFNKCDAGYKCGCSCTKNDDCDHSEMDLSCSSCVDKDQSGYGRCRSKFCGQACSKDSDCADAQSCPKCTSNVCAPTVVPDPLPGNCVLPFPGHPHKNCSQKLDLMLLLDGSGSIGESAWKKILHFTAGIGLNFTTGSNFMNYGIVEFSGEAKTFLPLTNSNASFQQVVATLPYFGRSTDTFSGFAAVEKEFNAHSRVGAFKVMIVLTDGMWNNGGDPGPISKRLKANHTKVFTIAVGDAATKEVAALASLPLSKYYYTVSNEQFLPKILHKMILGLCNRDDDDEGTIADEVAASEQWTEQLKGKGNPRVVSSRRRLDWSNITAAGTFDCGGDNSSRWIVVENNALNPMRIRTCDVDYNKEVCKGVPTSNQTGYTQCAPNGNPLAFIPPQTSVALRVPLNVTYIVALYCVDNPGRSIHCLSTPTPLEFYGPNAEGGGFPINGLVVPKATKVFCSVDVDCAVGETCDVTSHTCG